MCNFTKYTLDLSKMAQGCLIRSQTKYINIFSDFMNCLYEKAVLFLNLQMQQDTEKWDNTYNMKYLKHWLDNHTTIQLPDLYFCKCNVKDSLAKKIHFVRFKWLKIWNLLPKAVSSTGLMNFKVVFESCLHGVWCVSWHSFDFILIVWQTFSSPASLKIILWCKYFRYWNISMTIKLLVDTT